MRRAQAVRRRHSEIAQDRWAAEGAVTRAVHPASTRSGVAGARAFQAGYMWGRERDTCCHSDRNSPLLWSDARPARLRSSSTQLMMTLLARTANLGNSLNRSARVYALRISPHQ